MINFGKLNLFYEIDCVRKQKNTWPYEKIYP